MLFVAGLVSVDREGRLVGRGDLKAQVTQIIANMKAFLAEAGATLLDVVQLRVFTIRIDEMRSLGKWRAKAFPELWRYDQTAPSSTTVQVDRLADPDFLVEIEAVAVVEDKASRKTASKPAAKLKG